MVSKIQPVGVLKGIDYQEIGKASVEKEKMLVRHVFDLPNILDIYRLLTIHQ